MLNIFYIVMRSIISSILINTIKKIEILIFYTPQDNNKLTISILSQKLKIQNKKREFKKAFDNSSALLDRLIDSKKQFYSLSLHSILRPRVYSSLF